MENKLRSIFITGGTGKIGSVLVKNMIADGHHVIFSSTSEEKANNLISGISAKDGQLSYVIMKLQDDFDLITCMNSIPFEIDTIIHNARDLKSLRIEKNGNSTNDNIISEFNIGVVYPYLINNSLIERGDTLRDIIFISSMYGSVAPNKNLYPDLQQQSPIQYGIAKAAQIHIVKELAVRLADQSIRVNAISYGGVEGRAPEAFVKKYNRLCPSGKMLQEGDLYPGIQLLLNNIGLDMTGQNIKIDGGWTIW